MKLLFLLLLFPCCLHAQQRAYNKDSTQWLESDDTARYKVEYFGQLKVMDTATNRFRVIKSQTLYHNKSISAFNIQRYYNSSVIVPIHNNDESISLRYVNNSGWKSFLWYTLKNNKKIYFTPDNTYTKP